MDLEGKKSVRSEIRAVARDSIAASKRVAEKITFVAKPLVDKGLTPEEAVSIVVERTSYPKHFM